ncbi:SDR family NAD(P)-dependent oxidoreductase [Pontibacter sp. HJ8]
MSVEDFVQNFKFNVYSLLGLSQLCAPHLKKASYGSFFNMSSMSSVNKSLAKSDYAAYKADINHMTTIFMSTRR